MPAKGTVCAEAQRRKWQSVRKLKWGQEAGADGRAVGRAGSRVLVPLRWLSGWGRGVKGGILSALRGWVLEA